MTKYSYFGSQTGEYLAFLPYFTTFATFRSKMRGNKKFKT